MRRKYTLVVLVLVISVIKITAQVQSIFTPSVLFGCPPLIVNFQDQSTGSPTTFYWDFDGSGTSTLQNPSTTFVNSGIYNVMHVVSNGSTFDTAYVQIRVFVVPTVNFMAPDNHGCIYPCHTVHFVNQTIPGESPVTEYVWDFGDGTLPQQSYNADHCYNTTGSFTVTLVALDSNTCQTSSSITNYVIIGTNPNASIDTVTPVHSCSQTQPVHFAGSGQSSNGGISYAWYFGNGATSALSNPTQVYFSGIYDPILIVTDAIGCQDTAYSHVEVTDVTAGFMTSSNNACTGIPVQFTDTSNFANRWLWDFGDNTTATQQNPLHTYNTNGNYTVTLTVSYIFGNDSCTDVISLPNYINVSTPIASTLSVDDTSNCAAPFTVNFTGNATGASSYMWDFGDGTTSNQASPSHTYTANGVYTVTLGVSNSSGCVVTQTLSNQISVGSLQAVFSLDSNEGCTPLTVHFTNNSVSNSPLTIYFWDFGDGNFSNQQNPVHVYNAEGLYVPVFIVQNADGCVDTVAYNDTIRVGQTVIPSFVATPLIQCVNQQLSFSDSTQNVPAGATYLWDFGDGQTSTLHNPNHFYSDTGEYDITLTIKNQGCIGDTVKLKYIKIVVPKADFYFDFDCANPTAVAFHDTSQGAETWLWEFGDGTTSTLQNPTHNYSTQGNYSVTLIVTNSTTGCVDSTTKNTPIGTPNAGFTSDTTRGCLPLTIHFSDTSTFASGWLWSFGDGSSSSNQNPTHTFTDTGKYTVTLLINPGDSCRDSIVRINYITVYGVRGFISATPTTGCTPLTVAFLDSTSSYQGVVNSWTWSFGNGDSSFIQNPIYTFDSSGNFQVRLKVRDNHGCTSTFTKNIGPKHATAWFTSDTAVCPGELVHFDNLSTGANQYQWYFGDGTSSTLSNPNHTYANSGTYPVTLIASNNIGCSDTLVLPNFMHVDTPVANFYAESNFASCPPFPAHFHNTTNRFDLQWLWYFGDGDTSTERDPLHVYLLPGDYDVALVAWDSSGCRDSIMLIDYIRVRGPVGHFIASTDSGCLPLTVSITGTIATDVVKVHADWGDGYIVEDSINLTHTYLTAGNWYPVYTLTDSVGCVVSYPVDTIIVGIIPYPDLPTDTTVCKGNWVEFNLQYGDIFSWTSNLSPDYLTCIDCRNPISSAPDTITYYVTATTNIGCVARDTITVNVDALPQIFPGLFFRICPGDTLQLTAGNNVASAVWTPNLFINDTNFVNPLVWPPDTQTYRVTGTNSTGCSISRIVKVWMIDKVVADLSLLDTLVCDGGDIQFLLNVREASYNDTSFLWTPATYLNLNIIEDPLLSAPVGDYYYQVIVSSSTCVADTDTVHVTIAPKPTIEAGDNQTVTEGTKIQLYAASPDQVNYQWFPVDEMSCTSCRRPYLTVTQDQRIPVVVINQWGCKDSAFVDIKVVACDASMVYVPNTFTPNNDGLNDILYARGIGLRSLEYFRVFDRWGHLMFETKNLTEGWDGKIGGKDAEIATYVYLVKGYCSSGNTVEKSGNVTLVR